MAANRSLPAGNAGTTDAILHGTRCRQDSRQYRHATGAGNDRQDVNLQNRDRGRAASVAQMQSIAKNPDYLRLGQAARRTQERRWCFRSTM